MTPKKTEISRGDTFGNDGLHGEEDFKTPMCIP